ncbi:hypothetical protein HCC30_14395 [Streptomyces sp. HNM0574]|nr:hypothetical protein [Streptomyces sp. HNM0574]
MDARLPWPERRRAFRDWRRRRPFWAGLLLIAGGLELVAVPLAPLTVLISLGLGGLAALGIGLALVVAGVFLWAAPHTRHYVSVNALLLSVLSFAATNLGGFLVGMLLGIAGSALGFGWTPESAPEKGTRRKWPARAPAVVLPLCLLALLAPPREARALARAEVPPAGSVPPTITAARFAPEGFTVAGVREVPTADGPVRAMVVRMDSASLTDYRLRTRDGSRTAGQLGLTARSLRLDGSVTLYLTRLRGCVQGALCLTFTPDRLPVPPLIPPLVFLTDIEAEQALVTSDTIEATALGLRAGR